MTKVYMLHHSTAKGGILALTILLLGCFSISQAYPQELPPLDIKIVEDAIDNYLDLLNTGARNGYYHNNFGTNWNKGQSSFLIERGQPADAYHRERLFDNTDDTCWVEGVDGFGRGEYVMYVVEPNSWYSRYHNDPDGKLTFTIKLKNGFGRNRRLFEINNRLKNVEITVYDVALGWDGEMRNGPVTGRTIRDFLGPPTICAQANITLEDRMDEQVFEITGRPRYEEVNGRHRGVLFLVAVIRIVDVYKGTQYDDTCLNELEITASSSANPFIY